MIGKREDSVKFNRRVGITLIAGNGDDIRVPCRMRTSTGTESTSVLCGGLSLTDVRSTIPELYPRGARSEAFAR